MLKKKRFNLDSEPILLDKQDCVDAAIVLRIVRNLRILSPHDFTALFTFSFAKGLLDRTLQQKFYNFTFELKTFLCNQT